MDIQLINCRKPFSFQEFLANIRDRSTQENTSRAIRRIFSLMRKMDASSLVLETLDYSSDEEARIDLESIASRGAKKIKLYRLTFIDRSIKNLGDIVKLPDDAFLASVYFANVLLETEEQLKSIAYIPSSFITVPSSLPEKERSKIDNDYAYSAERVALLNNYIHVKNEFMCHVGIDDKGSVHTYNLMGSYFSQQNTLTSACAHAAIKMLVNTSTQKFITTEYINLLIKKHFPDDPAADNPGKEGLNAEMVKKVFDECGIYYEPMDLFSNPNEDYGEAIHHYLESRCPVLLAFTTHSNYHVVTVIGHTLNSDLWQPEAEHAYIRPNLAINQYEVDHIPAAAWVDHLIIHDDNFGPYLCLPIESLKKITLPKYDRAFRAYYIIGVLPLPISANRFVTSSLAEAAAFYTIKSLMDDSLQEILPKTFWVSRLRDIVKSPTQSFVMRTFLVSRSLYEQHLKQKDFHDNELSAAEQAYLLEDLPDWFYLSEISITDLYTANKTKLVDILSLCEHDGQDDLHKWLAATHPLIRFPGFSIKYKQDAEAEPIDNSTKSHFYLLESDLSPNKKCW